MEKTKSVPFNGTQEQDAMLHAVIDELRCPDFSVRFVCRCQRMMEYGSADFCLLRTTQYEAVLQIQTPVVCKNLPAGW